MPLIEIRHVVDARGLPSSLTLAKTQRVLEGLDPGTHVELVTTDPHSIDDVLAWSRASGNAITDRSSRNGVYEFVLRRR